MKRFHIIGQTSKGPVRTANEDHILVARLIKNRGRVRFRLEGDDDFLAAHGLLLAVADGVGGEAGGARASRLGLAGLDREFYRSRQPGAGPDEVPRLLREAAAKANAGVLKDAEAHPRFSGMGATLAGVCLTAEGYLVFNAGDSRVYRLRNGFLKQLTSDDTLVAQAVRQGAMTPDEARVSSRRHIITNCLGSSSLKLSVQEGPSLRSGDSLLICSDGLHDLVSHDRLEETMAIDDDPDAVMTELFRAAVAGGGNDNISAILIKVEGGQYNQGRP